MQQAVLVTAQVGEVLGVGSFTVEELAHSAGVAVEWVHARVEAGVLHVDSGGEPGVGLWRFDSVALVRARRIAQFETVFDADPQLAALTADLIEEVTRLRRHLAALGSEPA